MNVNAVSQLPDSIIKSKFQNNLNEGMFANMLSSALTDNQNTMGLIGGSFENLLSADDIDIGDNNVELDEDDDAQISYENLVSLADIFFFRSNLVIKEVMTENKALNFDYDLSAAQVLSKGFEQIKGDSFNPKTASAEGSIFEMKMHKEKPTIDSNSKSLIEAKVDKSIEALSEKTFELKIDKSIEAQGEKFIKAKIEKPIEVNEKQKSEFANAEPLTAQMPSTENKIITIGDGSTEIKSQVLTQVKDKIIIMTDKGQDAEGIKTITMELRPQALGKLDIKMSYENKKLTVEIKALNEETQKTLLSNVGELKEMLGKTSEADVNIIVKPYAELKNQNIPNHPNNRQGYEHNFYQGNEQNHQGRQRNKYYNSDNAKQSREDIFSELIDANYSRIKEDIHGD